MVLVAWVFIAPRRRYYVIYSVEGGWTRTSIGSLVGTCSLQLSYAPSMKPRFRAGLFHISRSTALRQGVAASRRGLFRLIQVK